MEIFNNDNTIKFIPDGHVYIRDDQNKEILTSVTRTIKKFIVPFDRDTISLNMARQVSFKKGIGVKEAQKQILDEWDAKRISAANRGNFIHDNLEQYLLKGECDSKLNNVVIQLQSIFKKAYRFYTEALTYSLKYMTAGMADLVIQRQRGIGSIFDFYDYKTNEAKGIQFDSINRKKTPEKHYNRFLLPPLNHLEDCNYVHYSIQLSLYAFLAQITWGLRIGRLAILFINNDYELNIYPVPYMEMEVKALLEYNLQLKPLPEVKSVPVKQNQIEEDDW